MKPLTPHERAALGLRQTICDLECSTLHLDMVLFSVDSKIAGFEAAIEAVKQEIAGVREHVVACQRKVYADWHELQPPLNFS